jgi:hypothetical protein
MLPPMLTDAQQQATDCHGQSEVPPTRATQRRQKSRGQSMVEFAILLPTLVAILAIAADFGRAFTAYIQISGAAREGAVSAMQTGDLTNVEAVVDADIGSGGSIWGTNVGVSSATGVEPVALGGYEYVEVTVSYTFNPIIPLADFVPLWDAPSTIPMERTVRMRVLN